MSYTYDLFRTSDHFQKQSAPSAQSTLRGTVPCRRLRATGAGTITVKRASDSTSVVLDVADGEYIDVACSEITSVSGTTAVTVFW